MQQVVLRIDDPALERAMTEIARREGLNLHDVMMQAIRSFISQKAGPASHLDPFSHSSQIAYPRSDDLSEVQPFAQVNDSARFGRDLRDRSWNSGR